MLFNTSFDLPFDAIQQMGYFRLTRATNSARLQEAIHSNTIKEKYRKSEKDFTRN
jgi:hypothetical protein